MKFLCRIGIHKRSVEMRKVPGYGDSMTPKICVLECVRCKDQKILFIPIR